MNHPQSSGGPRVIAWEVTRRCPLACRHCRAGAANKEYAGELSTEECIKVLHSIAAFARPMIIWTGGEPMCRRDIIRLVHEASELGLRSVMAPCGALATKSALEALLHAGVMACSFSLDGADEATHDSFRGVQGAYKHIVTAMKNARDAGMPFQINCTVSKLNVAQLPRIREMAMEFGAKTLDLFFLVPVGRGKDIANLALDSAEMERTLEWAFAMDKQGPIVVRETCAPQAVRIWEKLGRPGKHPAGCMGGKGFTFISHKGVLQPCGFLDIPCGDLHDTSFDFRKAYEDSPLFQSLRDPNNLKNSCGACRFRFECGGCRARAFANTQDPLEQDLSCPLARVK